MSSLIKDHCQTHRVGLRDISLATAPGQWVTARCVNKTISEQNISDELVVVLERRLNITE